MGGAAAAAAAAEHATIKWLSSLCEASLRLAFGLLLGKVSPLSREGKAPHTSVCTFPGAVRNRWGGRHCVHPGQWAVSSVSSEHYVGLAGGSRAHLCPAEFFTSTGECLLLGPNKQQKVRWSSCEFFCSVSKDITHTVLTVSKAVYWYCGIITIIFY